MSTKGLIADKRVAEVTLDDKGKAKTLTLRAPYLFEGSAGPFTLNNVDHGHKIVKAASLPAGAAPPPSAPRTARPASGATGEGEGRQSQPPAPRTAHPVFIYRWRHFSPSIGHEIVGWIKANRLWPDPEIIERVRNVAALSRKVDVTDYEPSYVIWTAKMEKEARIAGNAGCPWPSEVQG